MSSSTSAWYRLMRRLIGVALGFYFRRIERFHAERVPATGPVLFVSNHPNSVTDSFVIGASVARKVNFVATVQLFRFRPLKWLLLQCGVIPINRVRDDPRAMRTVADTFEACYRVLEAGEAVGIFPEGITYEDSQLKEVKSGAARMTLELEHRHGGKLGLQLAPVGLTYSSKETYRSDVLVHFGQPLRAADFLTGYEEHRKAALQALTAEIERRLQALILHLPHLEQARVIEGVKRLYLDRLKVGGRVLAEPASGAAEALLLSQRIARVVEHVYAAQPERAAQFAARLDGYERWLGRLKLADPQIAELSHRSVLVAKGLADAAVVVLGAPVGVYGWLHRLIPYAIVAWAVSRFPESGKRKAQTSTTVLVSGVLAFGLCYSAYVGLVHHWVGWPASLWYAVSLPVASLLAHYYWRELGRLAERVRDVLILIRAPRAANHLQARRERLIAEIEVVRAELATAGHPVP